MKTGLPCFAGKDSRTRMQSLPGSLFPSPKRVWGRGYLSIPLLHPRITYSDMKLSAATNFSEMSTQLIDEKVVTYQNGSIQGSIHTPSPRLFYHNNLAKLLATSLSLTIQGVSLPLALCPELRPWSKCSQMVKTLTSWESVKCSGGGRRL